MNFLMNLDLIAAVQHSGWTAYGFGGAASRRCRAGLRSYEHWVGYSTEGGFGVRAGRFLPAYGIRFSDHSAYTRTYLDSIATTRSTASRSAARWAPPSCGDVSPGKAEALLHDRRHRGSRPPGDGSRHHAATALVGSAFYRQAPISIEVGLGGRRLRIRATRGSASGRKSTPSSDRGTGGDVGRRQRNGGEAYRGLWLKFSPQLRTADGLDSRSCAGCVRGGPAAADALEHRPVVYHDHTTRSTSTPRRCSCSCTRIFRRIPRIRIRDPGSAGHTPALLWTGQRFSAASSRAGSPRPWRVPGGQSGVPCLDRCRVRR